MHLDDFVVEAGRVGGGEWRHECLGPSWSASGRDARVIVTRVAAAGAVLASREGR